MQKDYTFGCVSEEAFRAYFDDVTEYLKQKDISIRAELLLVGEPIVRQVFLYLTSAPPRMANHHLKFPSDL